MRHMPTLAFLTSLLALLALPSAASPGDPVAVRRVGDDTVRIETMWNLVVVLQGPPPAELGGLRPFPADADLVVFSGRGDSTDDSNVAMAVDHGRPLDAIIDRVANASRVSRVFGAGDDFTLSANSIRVRWMGEDAEDGYFLIEVDGVRIAFVPAATGATIEGMDVVLGPAAVFDTLEPLAARYFVPMDEMTQKTTGQREAVGNTLAVSAAATPRGDGRAVVVRLKTEPWTMPEALASLFNQKEEAARASMAVFAPMSADQMNHKPANGTHTPRWNVEHMTGTELAFFSKVYAKLDPEIRPIDRSPAQMPPEYVAREPAWTGAEEARQIERTQAFTRRFAYLLDGLPLDELPEGAPRFAGSLAGLFEKMSGHYPEHTAHVVEKTQQPDWPAD